MGGGDAGGDGTPPTPEESELAAFFKNDNTLSQDVSWQLGCVQGNLEVILLYDAIGVSEEMAASMDLTTVLARLDLYDIVLVAVYDDGSLRFYAAQIILGLNGERRLQYETQSPILKASLDGLLLQGGAFQVVKDAQMGGSPVQIEPEALVNMDLYVSHQYQFNGQSIRGFELMTVKSYDRETALHIMCSTTCDEVPMDLFNSSCKWLLQAGWDNDRSTSSQSPSGWPSRSSSPSPPSPSHPPSEEAEDGAAHNGAAHNDDAHNRAAHNGAAHNGAAHNGAAHSDDAHNGAAHNDDAHNGAAHNGAAHNGANTMHCERSISLPSNFSPFRQIELDLGTVQAIAAELTLTSKQIMHLLFFEAEVQGNHTSTRGQTVGPRKYAGLSKECMGKLKVALNRTDFPEYSHLSGGQAGADAPSTNVSKPHMEFKSHELQTLRPKFLAPDPKKADAGGCQMMLPWDLGVERGPNSQLVMARQGALGIFDVSPCIASKSFFIHEFSSVAVCNEIKRRVTKGSNNHVSLSSRLQKLLPEYYSGGVVRNLRREEMIKALGAVFGYGAGARRGPKSIVGRPVCEIILSDEVAQLL